MEIYWNWLLCAINSRLFKSADVRRHFIALCDAFIFPSEYSFTHRIIASRLTLFFPSHSRCSSYSFFKQITNESNNK